jgi:hypothetical protein
MNADKNSDESFEYRQLDKDLSHISESIIQSVKDGKCDLKAFGRDLDGSDPRFYCIYANTENSFIKMKIYFGDSDDNVSSYQVRVWDKNIVPTDEDKEIWFHETLMNKDISPEEAVSSVGSLVWECSDTEGIKINGRLMDTKKQYSLEIHSLIYQYVEKLQNVYFSSGGVSSKIKNLI